MTQLEAINEILTNAGEFPVDAVDTGNSAVAVALQKLNMVNKEVQSKGLNCNTDFEWVFTPDVNGYIPAPETVLSVDAVDPSLDIIIKDYKLYNRKESTFIFSDPVKAEVVWLLPFDDLPFYVANYITIRAARKYANSAITSETINSLTSQDEYDAKVAMMQQDEANADHSIFDSYSVYSVLDRNY